MIAKRSVRRVKHFLLMKFGKCVCKNYAKFWKTEDKTPRDLRKPQVQKKLLTESMGKGKSPGNLPKKELLMRSRALEFKW